MLFCTPTHLIDIFLWGFAIGFLTVIIFAYAYTCYQNKKIKDLK